ncbi:hypothetical protein AVEN_175623-1 [Araneus ventricosus]|uniref:Uncharacterized protein n=1 Tax=Araneus ventricosus TaxID=182803 RepID=A0A4Y2LVY5_ARAVE|nr:hypothetical protein AVEN_175623-1 [Araneus ventricosus]
MSGSKNLFQSRQDSGSLEIRCQPWGRRVPGSKPDSTENRLCILGCCTLNHTQEDVKRPPADVELHNPPKPAYPTGFKELKRRRGREQTSSRWRTPILHGFIIFFKIYTLHPLTWVEIKYI